MDSAARSTRRRTNVERGASRGARGAGDGAEVERRSATGRGDGERGVGERAAEIASDGARDREWFADEGTIHE